MNELTIHVLGIRNSINPEFLNRLESIASEYGLQIDIKTAMEENGGQQDISLNWEDTKNQKVSDATLLCLKEFVKRAEEIRKRIGPVASDSTEFLRSQRDQR